jgi:hypothetical protein
MAKNIIIWGLYHKSASGAVIKGQEDGLFQIKAWIGDKNICPQCTHNIEDFFQAQFGKKEYYGSGTEIYKDIYQDLSIFMDMFTRRNFPKDDKKIHDYLNAFNLFLDYFANLITTDRIDLVIFGNIPHEGHDFVLYRVAKALKVKTVMCYQSLFSNKFFYMYDLNDYGDFKEVPAQESNEYITVENKFEKELFYMDEVREKTSKKRIPNLLPKLARLFKLAKKLASKRWTEFPKLFLLAYQIKIRTKEYRQNLKRACCDQVDLHTKYVYFPLHLQPELTTASLGGIYGKRPIGCTRV